MFHVNVMGYVEFMPLVPVAPLSEDALVPVILLLLLAESFECYYASLRQVLSLSVCRLELDIS